MPQIKSQKLNQGLRRRKMKKTELKPGEIDIKINELKLELLKQPTKRKSLKKEIARLLTMKNQTKFGERN